MALGGLKDVITGETLCDEKSPIMLERMEFPDPVIKVLPDLPSPPPSPPFPPSPYLLEGKLGSPKSFSTVSSVGLSLLALDGICPDAFRRAEQHMQHHYCVGMMHIIDLQPQWHSFLPLVQSIGSSSQDALLYTLAKIVNQHCCTALSRL